MTLPRNTALAFDKIAAEIEPMLTRLGRSAPGAELETIRDEIIALLDRAGLRWDDVAARVTAPLPAKATDTPPCAPPPFYPPMPPRAELDPAIAVVTAGLTAQFGYRDRGDVVGMAGPATEA